MIVIIIRVTDCSIRVYRSFGDSYFRIHQYYNTNILPIMLALCSMLSDTYYAHNYAGIIGGSLFVAEFCTRDLFAAELFKEWFLCS